MKSCSGHKELVPASTQRNNKTANLESCDLTATMRSECENPPYDLMSSGSVVTTSASDMPRDPGSVLGRQLPKGMRTRKTELIRMEEVVDRLLDPYHQNSGRNSRGRFPNPYRPSVLQSPYRGAVDFTATWCGELRVQNEALVDENATAKEQTMRDLERLTAAGATTSTGIRGSYNQDQNGYMVSCSADMRPYALEDDDLRVPSFLRNRTRMPLRRMPIPGMRPDSEHSCDSTDADRSVGFFEMDLAMIDDYTNVVARTASSTSSSADSALSRGKLGALRNSKVAKCVKGLRSWRRFQKQQAALRETPAINEDRDYDFASDDMSIHTGNALTKGACFMCLGGVQPTKYSIDDPEYQPPADDESAAKASDFKSIFLTTSPLYGEVTPTPRSEVDELVYSTQRSLNIAATHNPTVMSHSDSDSESEVADKQRTVADMWDDDDDDFDRDSALKMDITGPMTLCDYTSLSGWEPPTLKTDQEYEMYQLQSRMDAEVRVRRRMSGRQLTPSPTQRQSVPPSPQCPSDDLLDTASMSSWDVKTVKEFSRDRWSSRGSPSLTDYGLDGQSIATKCSEFNNHQQR